MRVCPSSQGGWSKTGGIDFSELRRMKFGARASNTTPYLIKGSKVLPKLKIQSVDILIQLDSLSGLGFASLMALGISWE